MANVQYFSSINDIPTQIFEELSCLSNLYFNPQYLVSIEKNNSQMQFMYIVLFGDDEKPVGLAVLQLVDFYLDNISNEVFSLLENIKCLGRRLGILPTTKLLKVLVCGNIFVTGEHGIFIRSDQEEKRVLKQFEQAMRHLVHSNELLSSKVDAFIIKDFEQISLTITDSFHNEGYYSFKVDPNMVLTFRKEWKNFDDYLGAMRTKFRVKARKAMKKSQDLEVITITNETVQDILPQMIQLYKGVSKNANFNLGEFNLETYKDLKKELGTHYLLRGYWLKGELVGFLSGMINEDFLDAHFVGINYKLNKEYAIYQRMLYDYISIGISTDLRGVRFGRTASEIKSSVGAVPKEMTVYIRHKKNLQNRVLRLFLHKITPTKFQQKFPFKDF